MDPELKVATFSVPVFGSPEFVAELERMREWWVEEYQRRLIASLEGASPPPPSVARWRRRLADWIYLRVVQRIDPYRWEE